MEWMTQFFPEMISNSNFVLVSTIENPMLNENALQNLNALGWMLIHSLWQLCAIALLFIIGRQLIAWASRGSRGRASSRIYLWSILCLFAMVAAPIATWVIGVNGPQNLAVAATQIAPPSDALKLASERTRHELHASAPTAEISGNIVSNSGSTTQTQIEPSSDLMFVWIVAAWLVGMVLFSLRPILGLRQANYLATLERTDLPESILQIANRTAHRMGVSVAEFASSALVEVPTVIGYFSPVVLLPASAMTGLSTRQLGQILAHELAHIRRHDYLVNVIQTVIETVLFFHPAVWWLSNQVRCERENCCDDIAISHFGDSKSFVEALFSLEKTRTVAPPALAANGGSLVRRARRLLGHPSRKDSHHGSLVTASAAILFLALGLGLLMCANETVAQENGTLKTAPTVSAGQSVEAENHDTIDPIRTQDVKPTEAVLAVVNGQNIYKSSTADECIRRHGKDMLESMVNQQLVRAEGRKQGVSVSLIDIAQEIERQAQQFGMTQQGYVDLISSKRHISPDEFKNDFVGLEMLLKRLVVGRSAKQISSLFDDLKSQAKIINVLDNPEMAGQMPSIAAIVNDKEISMKALRKKCVSRFGKPILQRQVSKAILLQALKQARLKVEKADLDSEIAKVAVRMNFVSAGGAPDITKWYEFITGGDESKIDVYIEDEVWPSVALSKLVDAEIVITDLELQQVFESNHGERVEVMGIVLNDQRTASKVHALATARPTVQAFGELAASYSVGPASKNNHGLIPPIARHGGRAGLEKAAFALSSGDVSPIVQVGAQWVILKCLGRTKPSANFEDVKNEMLEIAREEKLLLAMQNKFAALTDAAQVEYKLENASD